MDDDLRESYCTLEKRLFHERRIVTLSFIAENNMLPFFQAIGLEPFLTLNEPICPRFVVEFYHSLKVKRNEEDTKFKLGVSWEDEAKRRNSGTKTETFEEICKLLLYAISNKEDTAYPRQLSIRNA
ncbi:hypothetical protein Tco_0256199 [Tanacetum coccineum]